MGYLYVIRINRRRKNDALKLGYRDLKDKRDVLRKGFVSAEERRVAEMEGSHSKKGREFLKAIGKR